VSYTCEIQSRIALQFHGINADLYCFQDNQLCVINRVDASSVERGFRVRSAGTFFEITIVGYVNAIVQEPESNGDLSESKMNSGKGECVSKCKT
jgi:hypothetical protein